MSITNQNNNQHLPASCTDKQNNNVVNYINKTINPERKISNSNNQEIRTTTLERNLQTSTVRNSLISEKRKNCQSILVIELDDSEEEDACENLNERTAESISGPKPNSGTENIPQESTNHQVAVQSNCASCCNHGQNSKSLKDNELNKETEKTKTFKGKILPERKAKKRRRKIGFTIKKSLLECEICHKILCRKDALKKHLLRHQDITKKPHECEVCKKKFSAAGNLKNHMISHSNEYPHVCYKCNKSFKYKGSLLIHLKMSCKKKFQCTVCFKIFKRQCHLSAHSRAHRKEKTVSVENSAIKNHVCIICDRKFTYKSQLIHHLKIHHDKKDYECHFCGKNFALKRYLYKHVTKHLNDISKPK